MHATKSILQNLKKVKQIRAKDVHSLNSLWQQLQNNKDNQPPEICMENILIVFSLTLILLLLLLISVI